MQTLSRISRCHVHIFIIVGSFLYCYLPVFVSLTSHWLSNDVYYHAFLIPVVSAYLIWCKQPLLSKCAPDPNYVFGGGLLMFGLVLFIAGQIAGVNIAQQLSLLVTLPALIVLVYGISYLRIILFPLAYLFFMIPIWVDILTNLHYPFQLLTADLATFLMQALSIPAFHDGIYIQLPDITLEIAKECSGIRYLIAVVALCLPLGHLFIKGFRRQLALLSFAVIIAMLGNGLRVALIGIFSFYHLADTTHGPAHIFQGLFVSVIGYVGIAIGLLILREKTPVFWPRGIIASSTVPATMQHPLVPALSVTLSLCAVFVALGVLRYVHQPTHTAPLHLLQQFPRVIGAWESIDSLPNHEIMKGLDGDRQLSRRYRGPSNETIDLYVGVHDAHTDSRSLDFDRLLVGTNRVSKEKLSFTANQDVTINRGYSVDSAGTHISYSWLSVDGSVWPSPPYAKLHMFWNAIRNRRTDIVLVLITIQGRSKGLDKNGEQALREFSREVHGALRYFFTAADNVHAVTHNSVLN